MDFAPRDKFSVIDGFVLHTMIAQTGLIGSPIIQTPRSVSRRCDTEGSSPSAPRASQPVDGAAATAFDLNACFKMGEGR